MGGVGKVVGNIFGGIFGRPRQEQPIAPPPVIEPPKMPTPNDAEVKTARRKSLAAQYSRRGRTSTILENAVSGSETLG